VSTTLPPNHQWVETDDGSFTLFSENFQEACHSSSGARAETLLHYIQGCKIETQLNSQNQLSILEVGFGLGIGFLTTFDVLKESQKPWSFISLEIDEKLLEWFRLENLNHPFLKALTWKETGLVKILEARSENIHLVILSGDARKTLPAYVKTHDVKWSAVYQDAFSPKRNPILWTTEWFEFLKSHATPEVLLSTYSASSSIRKSLLQAGWILHKGEKFGPKRTSTRAALSGVSDPEILLHLERSPTPALSDDNIESFLSK
jgi:tRNA U34 5-methylaminomethyl-2-thiouridine-forming methyltransferase MnmC